MNHKQQPSKNPKSSPQLLSPIQSMHNSPSRDSNLNLESGPGPGAYKLKSMFGNKTGFSIPSSKYHPKIYKNPDPWSYIPNDQSVKPNSPNTIFGSASRINYEKQGPSPSQYHPNGKLLFYSIRSPIFRKEKIVYKEREMSPGPGNYDLTKFQSVESNNRSIKIGKEKREIPNKQKQSIPAPNIYQSESDIDLSLKKKRGYSIGRSLKSHTQTHEPYNYLKYNSNKDIVMKKSPAFTFKRSIKKGQIQPDSPGPAKYESPKHQLKGIMIPKSQRRLHNLSLNPGPQTYSVQNLEQSPSFSIPKATYLGSLLARTPGPGMYTPQLPESKKYNAISIGVADRPNLVRNEKLPGPGQYNLAGRPKGGYSIGKGQRDFGIQQVKSPGPADYSVDVSLLKKFVSTYGN